MKLKKEFYEFEYDFKGDYVIINKCICPGIEGEIVFPSHINGKKVLKIGKNCCDNGDFWNVCSSIVIEEGIEEICDSAFVSCVALKKIFIPSTVMKLGNHIFEGCDNLEVIEIAEENLKYTSCNGSNVIVEKDTESLLYGTKVSSLPSGIKRIQSHAFHKIKGLETMDIPEGCEVLEADCISACEDLTTLKIPSTVKRAEKAISNCCHLSNVMVDSKNEYIKYDDTLQDFISISAGKASMLPLCDFTFVMEVKGKGFIEISYQKRNDTILIDMNHERSSFACGSLYQEALQDLSYMMGYVSENLNNPSINNHGYYSVSSHVRCTYHCKKYTNYNKVFTNEKQWLKLISILEYLSPIPLNELRNIPQIKYSVEDVNLEYITLPDIYRNMFDTYKAFNNGNSHPNDRSNILIGSGVFSHRDNLRYVKIRTSDCLFEKNLFDTCENLKAIAVEDKRVIPYLSKQAREKVKEVPCTYKNTVNEDEAF